jgi:hypothetical protein
MHFEILVEDQSGQHALKILVPKIIGAGHTFRLNAYKGIGRIPKNLNSSHQANQRLLFDQPQHLLRAYGNFANNPAANPTAVVVVCDLDQQCLREFRQELFNILDSCNPRPVARFCLAIEEGEAWFLGDITAIKKAYPQAKDSVLKAYVNDSICSSWEQLADALYKGGSAALRKKGGQAVGAEKAHWAERSSPHMDVAANASPSFAYFRKTLMALASGQAGETNQIKETLNQKS